MCVYIWHIEKYNIPQLLHLCILFPLVTPPPAALSARCRPHAAKSGWTAPCARAPQLVGGGSLDFMGFNI